jgi:hypothetical protein
MTGHHLMFVSIAFCRVYPQMVVGASNLGGGGGLSLLV